MTVALAQINPVVGDLHGNCTRVLSAARQAGALGADLVVFPELTLTGYPPDDLLEDSAFVRGESDARRYIAQSLPGSLGCIVGGLAPNPGRPGKPLHNAAYLYENGCEVAQIHKSLLPTYDVFDERRYFEPARECRIVVWRDLRLGLHICEDLWNADGGLRNLYRVDPVGELAAQGADLLINICASPFSDNKHQEREALIDAVRDRYSIPYVFVNQVGANTDLIFDGRSCIADTRGRMYLPAFEEGLMIWQRDTQTGIAYPLERNGPGQPPRSERDRPSEMELLRDALTLGIRDYFRKTAAFRCVFIGVSGGIDSAVTCALAVRALGADQVIGVAMPSRYSSEGSVTDAEALAQNLGIQLMTLPIDDIVGAFDSALLKTFEDTPPGTAEENVQARARGTLLMALANKFSGIVLNTGNKSELSMGYATLYGDMNGALGVLGDVYKTEVYALAQLLNRDGPCIPPATITKPPSAELRPDQTDQDSLPPYDVLDSVLQRLIEQRKSAAAIADETGIDRKLAEDICRQVDLNDYKRHQAPPSLRVSVKAFGVGRRLPVVKHRTAPPAFAAKAPPADTRQFPSR
ncbi:MAG: NAD+ synthase [Bacteroidota bacterium]|nr:NAD+ synthase [Bacteroidota bacterium]